MIRKVIHSAGGETRPPRGNGLVSRISRALGDDFVRRVDDAIVLAQEGPLAFQIVQRTFRRVLLHRFPYALFYHADESRIVIVAVLHQARDPEILRSRKA